MSEFDEELEDIDDTLLEVDMTTGEVRRDESIEPDANRALNIRGSASLIKAYQTCPAQAYGRITRQKQGKTLALVNGIAVHTGLESYAKEEGKDPQLVYAASLVYEAERNEVSLTGDKVSDAKKVGQECIGAGMAILDSQINSDRPLKKRIKKDDIECGFTFTRNGFLYVGKMDFIVFKRVEMPVNYYVADWKTGKNPPSGKGPGKYYELDKDIQFTLYAEGSATDLKLSGRTFGEYPAWNAYIHLRGASTEYDATGRRVAKTRTKKPLQYDFPTKRTKEEIDWSFATIIEPEMKNMTDGRWGRRPGKACSNCGFFNKDKLRCEVEIPQDATLKKEPQLSLIEQGELTASRAARLKPYSDKANVTS